MVRYTIGPPNRDTGIAANGYAALMLQPIEFGMVGRGQRNEARQIAVALLHLLLGLGSKARDAAEPTTLYLPIVGGTVGNSTKTSIAFRRNRPYAV